MIKSRNMRKRVHWISLSVCLSEKNYSILDLEKSDFILIAPLSVMIWKDIFGNKVKVFVQVLFSQTELLRKREAYQQVLINAGVDVMRWVYVEGSNCIGKAETIRAWAFKDPVIESDDIVTLADINCFPLSSSLLLPIAEEKDKKAWVFRYFPIMNGSFQVGTGFDSHLLSARAETWRKIIDPGPYKAPSEDWYLSKLVKIEDPNGKIFDEYYDNLILSYSLIENHLCNQPSFFGLDQFYDGKTCWKGKYESDCYAHSPKRAECQTYCFRNMETTKEKFIKFHKLTNNRISTKNIRLFGKMRFL